MSRAPLPKRPLSSKLYRAFIAEFIGTFFLVATIVLGAASPFGPFAIGFQLMTQIFAYGYISGGMYNPAVSFGIFMVRWKRGESFLEAGNEWLRFVLVQLTGGFSGALISWFLVGTSFAEAHFPAPRPVTSDSTDVGRAFVAELVFTFTLVSVVLNCALSKAYGEGNHFFGFAIGMAVFSGALAVGGISGAAFNPAVATALQVVQSMALKKNPSPSSVSYLWLYWISELTAGFLAALVFSTISCEDKDDEHFGMDETDVNASMLAQDVQRANYGSTDGAKA